LERWVHLDGAELRLAPGIKFAGRCAALRQRDPYHSIRFESGDMFHRIYWKREICIFLDLLE